MATFGIEAIRYFSHVRAFGAEGTAQTPVVLARRIHEPSRDARGGA
jgi:hypothetical protein